MSGPPRQRWEAVIGLELHVQLATRTKLFSACPAAESARPNTHTDPVSLGLPGTLPVLNREAVRLALRLAAALGAEVAPVSRFARKSYFYPDLPKNHQITQLEPPLASGGAIVFERDGSTGHLALERLHLEEDAGRSRHEDGRTRVDLERAGVPLVEVVTRPELHAPEDAAAVVAAVRELVRWIGVGEGRMERGQLRCDANVSVRPRGERALGTKVEVKNLNSMRHLAGALRYEVERQIASLEVGTPVRSQTRGFDPDTGRTHRQRDKESGADYRYLPEPDLPPLRIGEEELRAARASLGELPSERRRRLVDAGLSTEDAAVMTASRARADFFEAVMAGGVGARIAASWIRGELTRLASGRGETPEGLGLDPGHLADLLGRVERREIPTPAAREILAALVRTGRSVDLLVEQLGVAAIDERTLRATIVELLDAHPDEVAHYRAGKQGLLGWFTGRVLARTPPGSDPRAVQEMLRDELRDDTAGPAGGDPPENRKDR